MVYPQDARIEDFKAIAELYSVCFSAKPWNQELTLSEARRRIDRMFSLTGHKCFVAFIENKLIGAGAYDLPVISELRNERGEKLAGFIEKEFRNASIVWLRYLMVHPEFQNLGVGRKISEHILAFVKSSIKESLILTRLRDDNPKIVQMNSSLGFKRTGIKVPSQRTKGLYHEYWYLKIDA
ncbi:MAG: GNAT family N-acetyltransferase [Bacillota bacterium]